MEGLRTTAIPARESAMLNEILAGNIPSFLSADLCEVQVEADGHQGTFYVAPDYLAVGTNEDFVRTPLNPLSAQKIADAFGCVLPTAKMTDLIWKAADAKLPPAPWGPLYDDSMLSTDRIIVHNDRVQAQFSATGKPLGTLIAGIKKDVVLTNLLKSPPDHVAIYGWHKLNGEPIQGPPPNAVSHEITYADYSHGIRLVFGTMIVDGQPMPTAAVMAHASLCVLLSNEGPIKHPSY
jgi:hypothetical protein